MIVKNEEKILDRCLSTVVDLVDEVVIVDTGSTDATKEIAARYTDKIYDFRWIDDFSAARNFAFSKAMDYKGGAYGIGILSRYPIVESETVPLFYETEPRVLCHGRLDVEGKRVDFFNTHLDYISKAARAKEFGQLREILSSYDRYVLTGDFNTADMTEFEVLSDAVPVNHGQLGSFVATGKAIDNILYTPNFTLTDSGMDPVTHSDHYLIWAELEWKKA